MITVTECATFAGLASNELVLGAIPCARHHCLLSSYLLNIGRGPRTVRDMIIADMRRFLDLGVSKRAADLLIVLRMFLSDFPEARGSGDGAERTPMGAQTHETDFGGVSRSTEDKERGVVVSLSRQRRMGRTAPSAAARARSAQDHDSMIVESGSRLFYLRKER